MDDRVAVVVARIVRRSQRRRTSRIPIVFLTAVFRDEAHLFQAYSAGAVDVVFKPLDPFILRSKVQVLVDLHLKTLAVQQQAERSARLLAENVRVQREKLQAEQALRRSQERQAAILKSLPIVFHARSVEPPYQPLFLSNNVEALTGFPAERFLEDPGFGSGRIHPDDVDLVPEAVAGARKRLDSFLDPEPREEIGRGLRATDPLGFKDTRRYADRLEEARSDTDEEDALIVLRGRLKGLGIVACAFEFSFMGGSMGSVVGEKFVRGVDACLENGEPLVCFSASGGARMQESLFSLMQMAKTSAALTRLADRGLPFISVMTHPTMGGVSASLAMLGDLNVAEPGARHAPCDPCDGCDDHLES